MTDTQIFRPQSRCTSGNASRMVYNWLDEADPVGHMIKTRTVTSSRAVSACRRPRVDSLKTEFPYQKMQDPFKKVSTCYALQMNALINKIPQGSRASKSMVKVVHAQNCYQESKGPYYNIWNQQVNDPTSDSVLTTEGKEKIVSQLASIHPMTPEPINVKVVEMDKRKAEKSQAYTSSIRSSIEEKHSECSSVPNDVINITEHINTHQSASDVKPMGTNYSAFINGSNCFRTIGRKQRTQMRAFLRRDDEGSFSNLNQVPAKTISKNRKAKVFSLDQSTDHTVDAALCGTFDERSTYMDADHPRNKFYYKESAKQMTEQLSKFEAYKQMKANIKRRARLDFIVQNRHKMGLIGHDNPERGQSEVPEVYKTMSKKLADKSKAFKQHMERRCQSQIRNGGASSQTNYCLSMARQANHGRSCDKIQDINHLFQRRGKPQLAKRTLENICNSLQCSTIQPNKKQSRQPETISSLIHNYDNKASPLKPRSRYQDSNVRRCVKEKRNFNILSGQQPLANNFM